IDSSPSDPSSSSSASFAFSGSDASPSSGGLHFQCKLDDAAAFTACSSPQNYSVLADGSHSFQVRAIDAAGNTDATPTSQSWQISTGPPDTTITSGPSGAVSSSGGNFAFVSSQSNSTFECSLDGSSFAP